MKNQKRRNKRQAKNLKKNFKMFLFSHVLYYIKIVIDIIVDFFFGIYYGDKKHSVPPLTKSILIESATSIANKIRKREVTSEEVVRAYIDRCQEVNGIINAVIDNRFEVAIEEAKQVDKDLLENKYSDQVLRNKPFLGVPFTTKDSTACKGMLWTFGLKARKDVRATEDADVVAKMKSAGAILIATTNVPEFNLWQECRNNVFGQTNNPYDTTRTTGGSSGGEAALIASCGSPIGIGTDIGGSIRMPCFFCGLFGHKPTCNIISTKGLTRRTGEEKTTMVVAGPMSRHSEDLIPTLKVLAGPNVTQLKLDQNVDIRKLKIGYFDEPGDLRCSPLGTELSQLMQKVVQHLNEILPENEPVKYLEMEETKYSYRLWRYAMSKEGVNFSYELTNRESKVNVFTEFPKKLCGKSNYTIAAMYKLVDDVLPKENPKWAEDTTKSLHNKMLAELSSNSVILYPSYPWTARHHFSCLLRPFNLCYWGIFNVLKFPVTQVPLGLSEEGLPVGIQVVAAPYNDHLSIAVARYLEKTFGGYVPPFINT